MPGVDHAHELTILSSVLGGASAFGSAAVVLSYILFKDCRSLSRHLVSILAFCDLGQGLFFAVQSISGGSCVAQALFGIFIATSSFIWTSCIAFFVHKVVEYPEQNFRSLLPYFHAISWGYPLIFCILLGAINPGSLVTTSDLPWCFIAQTTTADVVWRMFAIFIPLFVCWVLTIVWYLSAVNRLRRLAAAVSAADKNSNDLAEVRNKLMIVPICFILTRVWGAVLRFIEIPNKEAYSASEWAWLQWMTAIGDPLQGVTNFIVFVAMTKKVRVSYYEIFCKCRRPTAISTDATGDTDTDNYALRDPSAGGATDVYSRLDGEPIGASVIKSTPTTVTAVVVAPADSASTSGAAKSSRPPRGGGSGGGKRSKAGAKPARGVRTGGSIHASVAEDADLDVGRQHDVDADDDDAADPHDADKYDSDDEPRAGEAARAINRQTNARDSASSLSASRAPIVDANIA